MDRKLEAALEEVKPQPLATRSKWLKTFFYGEYGTGKTKLAAELIQHKGLLIATDTGTDTLYNWPHLLDKVDVVPYSGLSQLTAIAAAIMEGHQDYVKYDTIIIDTISQIQEEYLDWLGDNFTYSGNQRVVATPVAGAPRGLSSVEITGLPDYHLARNKMRSPLKDLIKAPVHVHFLAHVREPSAMDIQKAKLVRRPSITESVFKLIAREISLMGLLERDGNKMTVQFATDKKTVSKSRISELDNVTMDTNLVPDALKKWIES